MHHEACPCGNPSPWLTPEGRTDDIVTFVEERKEIKIAPLAIYAVLKEVDHLQRFQAIVHKKNEIELRMITKNGYSKEEF